MRLFLCVDCQVIEQVPDYEGPMIYDPQYNKELPVKDDLLEYVIAPHKQQEHRGTLMHIDQEDWEDDKKRDGILKEIRDGLGKTPGLDPEAYAMRDTFQEDALKCFSAHNRPQGGCIDYKDRSKRIGNSMLTDEERADVKKFGLKRVQQRYLCEWCPVHTNYVEKKQNEASGLYR